MSYIPFTEAAADASQTSESLVNHPVAGVLEYTQYIRVNIKMVIFNILLLNQNPNRK